MLFCPSVLSSLQQNTFFYFEPYELVNAALEGSLLCEWLGDDAQINSADSLAIKGVGEGSSPYARPQDRAPRRQLAENCTRCISFPSPLQHSVTARRELVYDIDGVVVSVGKYWERVSRTAARAAA